MPTPLLPDVVGVVITALAAQSPLSALVGARIYDRIPASPTFPLLVVDTVDEGELAPETLEARVQVDVWGAGSTATDELAARTIARTLVSVSRDLRGSWTGGRISNSAHALTIPAPDPDSGRVRFVVDFTVWLTAS